VGYQVVLFEAFDVKHVDGWTRRVRRAIYTARVWSIVDQDKVTRNLCRRYV
jgi:hypothetical protein